MTVTCCLYSGIFLNYPHSHPPCQFYNQQLLMAVSKVDYLERLVLFTKYIVFVHDFKSVLFVQGSLEFIRRDRDFLYIPPTCQMYSHPCYQPFYQSHGFVADGPKWRHQWCVKSVVAISLRFGTVSSVDRSYNFCSYLNFCVLSCKWQCLFPRDG